MLNGLVVTFTLTHNVPGGRKCPVVPESEIPRLIGLCLFFLEQQMSDLLLGQQILSLKRQVSDFSLERQILSLEQQVSDLSLKQQVSDF